VPVPVLDVVFVGGVNFGQFQPVDGGVVVATVLVLAEPLSLVEALPEPLPEPLSLLEVLPLPEPLSEESPDALPEPVPV
jgi:hypothetical protein